MIVPKIWVADLAAYNAGTLHGEWIDATLGFEAVHERIAAILASSPVPDAEEFAIFDYEDFCGIELGEYESIERVCEIAELLDEIDEPELLGALAFEFGLDEAKQMLDESYAGSWDSVGDFAASLYEGESIPRALEMYIDFDALGRDMRLRSQIVVVDVGREVHIFWHH